MQARKFPPRIENKDTRELAMEAAFQLLKVRRRSEKELAGRLALRGFSVATVAAALARLVELGLLNDEALARDWAASRRSAGEGDLRIRRKLLERGLGRDRVDQAMAEAGQEARAAGQEEDEDTRAWNALTRRAKRMAGLDRDALYRRLGGYLVRQGFTIDSAKKALRRFLAQLGEAGDAAPDEFE